MAEKKNLLPLFSGWSKANGTGTEVTDSLAVTDDGLGCSFTITHESSYLYYSLRDVTGICGHTLAFSVAQFDASDGLGWIQVRLYNADQSSYTRIDFKSADTSFPLETEIEVPADCGMVRVSLRHEWDSDGIDPPCTITASGVSLVDTYTESLTALNFHKVLEENLPARVTPGTQHIYYTTDGTTVHQYIANKEGYLIPVGSVSSGGESGAAEYTNAYTQQHIDERRDDIIALTRQGHCIVFAVATDIHVRIEDGDGGRYNQVRDFIMLSRQLPLDYVLCEGDIMSYCQTWDKVFEPRIEKVKDILNQCRCPWWATRGNHDYNDDDYGSENNSNIQPYTPENAADYFITDRDWHRSVSSQMPVPIGFEVHFDEAHPQNGYFYVDDFAQKHRMIFCNSEETMETDDGKPYITADGAVDAYISGIESRAQIEWLLGRALDMTGKTDWVVSFHSHTVPYTDAGEEDRSEFHGYGEDNPSLRAIVRAFQTGGAVSIPSYSVIDVDAHAWQAIRVEKDFSAQGPIAVIGWFGGHCHDDNHRNVDGLNVIVSTCTCAERRTEWKLDQSPVKLPPERNSAELAMSVNVFVVNKDTRTIHVVKVGSKRDNADRTSSDFAMAY